MCENVRTSAKAVFFALYIKCSWVKFVVFYLVMVESLGLLLQ